MKITAIKPYPIWDGGRNLMIVKIETDEGISGWGESGISSRELAVEGAIKHYREYLIGQNPMQIAAHWQRMYRSQYFEGGRVLTAAISAVDIALHDIKAKSLNLPVYELLGGKQRNQVPCFGTTDKPMGEEMIKQGQEFIESGWQAIRLSWKQNTDPNNMNIFEPRDSISETAEWMIQARETLGSNIVLGIDYHHRLSVAEAASFSHKLPTGTLDFIEEPIRDESPQAYKSLRTMTEIPFAIGEEMSSKWQFMPFIEENLTQFARIDICNVGGFTESSKVTGWAEAHYIDMMPHNPLGPICTAASIQMAAATPNFAWLEARATPNGTDIFDSTIFPKKPEVKNGKYDVSDEPGLGIEINEEALIEYNFKFWEAPHLQKSDGSYTNW